MWRPKLIKRTIALSNYGAWGRLATTTFVQGPGSGGISWGKEGKFS